MFETPDLVWLRRCKASVRRVGYIMCLLHVKYINQHLGPAKSKRWYKITAYSQCCLTLKGWYF